MPSIWKWEAEVTKGDEGVTMENVSLEKTWKSLE